MVKKPNKQWSMYVDFTGLNKVCPKDNYPLPSIDHMIDSTVCYQVYSFMDAYASYHQIKMNEFDEEKTTFIADWGLYYYTAMPFGLKNTSALY